MIDNAYNRSQLDDMSIKIIYEIGDRILTFNFRVFGFNLTDDFSEGINIYLEYFYSCWLYSVTDEVAEFKHTWSIPNCSDYFRQSLQIKDMTFLTDLILEVRYFGNPRGITDEQICDNKFLNKLRDAYRKEQNLQEDFK